MRALTIWQPWASLIAWEEKRYETRSWETKYRGPLAIHAGLDDLTGEVSDSSSYYRKIFKDRDIDLQTVPVGAVLCVVDLVATIPIGAQKRNMISPQEEHVGDWSSGRFAWQLENVRVLKEPIYVKGKQGLWNWPVELESLEFVEVKP